ncbi:MAG: hypothetical protein E7158_03885 [Firmicutes bacterium]|nr:hypothetical protein [Bacillota bacterium]
MGKVVILGGNARSGKTTLAYKLQKQGFNRISFDLLNTYIEDGLNINFDDLSEEKKFNFFESVVNEAVSESENEDINIVVDMYDYLPKDIEKLSNKDKVETYFFAYPECTKEEIKYNVVHYAKPTDWIAQVNEEYLNSCVDRFYERNKILVEECNKYNINLIDTKSGDERNKIIEDLFNKIINK